MGLSHFDRCSPGVNVHKKSVSVKYNILIISVLVFFVDKCTANELIRIGYITGSEQWLLDTTELYDRPGQKISGALTYAIAEINSDETILPNHYLDFIIAETYGKESESIRQTVLLLDKNISVYIGPQETCIHEGRIAASFNIPMISYAGKDNKFRIKSRISREEKSLNGTLFVQVKLRNTIPYYDCKVHSGFFGK